jgi:hypothetical protein
LPTVWGHWYLTVLGESSGLRRSELAQTAVCQWPDPWLSPVMVVATVLSTFELPRIVGLFR